MNTPSFSAIVSMMTKIFEKLFKGRGTFVNIFDVTDMNQFQRNNVYNNERHVNIANIYIKRLKMHTATNTPSYSAIVSMMTKIFEKLFKGRGTFVNIFDVTDMNQFQRYAVYNNERLVKCEKDLKEMAKNAYSNKYSSLLC